MVRSILFLLLLVLLALNPFLDNLVPEVEYDGGVAGAALTHLPCHLVRQDGKDQG